MVEYVRFTLTIKTLFQKKLSVQYGRWTGLANVYICLAFLFIVLLIYV